MLVCDYSRHFEFLIIAARFVYRLKHSHLGKVIEIDIVLTNELINYRVVIAPVVFPFVAAVSYALKICLRKRDRCPERLGPYPEGESLYAVLFGNGNTPVDIA